MLSIEHTLILRALVNCIIPEDDYPNGWDAGVNEYLFRQFEGDLADKIPTYQDGLTSLNAESQAIHNKEFAKLSAGKQEELLKQIEIGEVKAQWTVDPASFFKMAIEHTTEGYYSDPDNGGNLEGISWQMIGFEVWE